MKTKILVVMLALIWGIGVNAQEEGPSNLEVKAPNISGIKTIDQIEGAESCFDYYKFGSIETTIDSRQKEVLAGTSIDLVSVVKNNNDYPVVDGGLFVKVFRKTGDSETMHTAGHNVVDEFFADEDIALNAGEEKTIEFSWKVPAHLLSGEYLMATYYVSAKKVSMQGLSFTDDITGGKYNFSVSSENDSLVEFDKSSVKVNDKDYKFIAFPPAVESEIVTIETDIVNDTDFEQIVPVMFYVYSWDGINEKNYLYNENKTYTIAANERKTVTLEIKDSKYSVYFVRARLDYKDTKSYLGIRYARKDVSVPRIDFTGLTGFPIKKGEQNTMFSCVHGAGFDHILDENKLILTLSDDKGNEIYTHTYEGEVTGRMMATKLDFTPEKSFGNVVLKTELYHKGELIDKSEVDYKCAEIDQKYCLAAAEGANAAGSAEKDPSKMALGLLIVIILGALATLAYHVKKHKSNKNMGTFIFLAVLSSIFFGTYVDAASVKTASSDPGYYAYWWDRYAGDEGWGTGLVDPNFEITYQASVVNANTGDVYVSGDQIPTGTSIKFVPKTLEDDDITWFGSGYTQASPYGRWLSNAEKPSEECASRDYVSTDEFRDDDYDVYIPFSVDEPSVSIAHNGTAAAGLTCINNGFECTVTSPGSISSTITYSDTYGKLYYSYYAYKIATYSEVDAVGCWTSKYAMRKQTVSSEKGYASVESSDYTVDFAPASISYNFTAVEPPATNLPPNAPSISVSGDPSGEQGEEKFFTAVATDPEGDTITYGFDFNNNGIVDIWNPGFNIYINSGVPVTESYTWSDTGWKTVKAKAKDSKGAESGWGTLSIEITAPAPPIPPTCPPATCDEEAIIWSGVCTGSCSGSNNIGSESGKCIDNCTGESVGVSKPCTLECPITPIGWIEVTP